MRKQSLHSFDVVVCLLSFAIVWSETVVLFVSLKTLSSLLPFSVQAEAVEVVLCVLSNAVVLPNATFDSLLKVIRSLLLPSHFLLDRALKLWSTLLVYNLRGDLIKMFDLLESLVVRRECYSELVAVAQNYIAFSPDTWNADMQKLVLFEEQHLTDSLSLLRTMLCGKTPQRWFDKSLSDMLLEIVRQQKKSCQVRALAADCWCQLWGAHRHSPWLPQMAIIALADEEFILNKRGICLYLCSGRVSDELLNLFASLCLVALEDLPDLPRSNPVYFLMRHLNNFPIKQAIANAFKNYPPNTISKIDHSTALLLREKLN